MGENADSNDASVDSQDSSAKEKPSSTSSTETNPDDPTSGKPTSEDPTEDPDNESSDDDDSEESSESETAETGETGDEETADEETEDEETGDAETGDEETGDEETGDEETGDEETGDEVDCENLPTLPIQEFTMVKGVPGTEDFSFDNQGHVIGVNDRVYKVTYEGELSTVAPDIGRAQGTQVLINGNYTFVQSPKITQITPNGSMSTLNSSVPGSNGTTLDREGIMYISDDNNITRLDPKTGKSTKFAEVPANDSNGITFGHDYKTLYVSTCGGHSSPHASKVYKIPINEDGTAGETKKIADVPLDSHVNGIAMDECGNLYVVASVGVILRLSPEAEWQEVVDFRSASPNKKINISAINFGSGVGGWKNNAIYVAAYTDEGFYEVDLGVHGKWEPHLQ